MLEADGMRSARILAAEGDAGAVRLVADAERYRLEEVAAGEANAITIVYGAIIAANPDQRLITLQYIESLKAIANGTANKVFIPYEASALMGAVGSIVDLMGDKSGPAPSRPAPAVSSTPSAQGLVRPLGLPPTMPPKAATLPPPPPTQPG